MTSPSLNTVITVIEAVVFSARSISKNDLQNDLNKIFKEKIDLDILEVAFEGLQQKYECELYGIYFYNSREYVSFYAKDINKILNLS